LDDLLGLIGPADGRVALSDLLAPFAVFLSV
jgi:hypothetical protein